MARQGMRSIVWILCIWGLSVLPECISQSVGFISLFCTAGALCQKAVCSICVALHFPEVSLALKVPDGLWGRWRCTDYASRYLTWRPTPEVWHGRWAERVSLGCGYLGGGKKRERRILFMGTTVFLRLADVTVSAWRIGVQSTG